MNFKVIVPSETYQKFKNYNILFKDLGIKAANLRPLWKKILPLMPQMFEEIFDTRGASLGTFWPPLAPSTLRQKIRRYPGSPILVASGRMIEGLVMIGSGTKVVWDSSKFEYGLKGSAFMTKSGVPYPSYVNLGAPRANLPARRFIGIPLNWIEKIKDEVLQFFLEKAKIMQSGIKSKTYGGV